VKQQLERYQRNSTRFSILAPLGKWTLQSKFDGCPVFIFPIFIEKKSCLSRNNFLYIA